MKSNLVLIGMPGAGKSCVGKALATSLGYAFMDTDAMIELETGMRITALFELNGEAFFREIETRCVMRAAKAHRCVIATGGGVILREENMRALRRSGKVIYLRRNLNAIMQENLRARPLLAQNPGRLQSLFAQRKALYEYYGECIIDNDGAINDAVARIGALL